MVESFDVKEMKTIVDKMPGGLCVFTLMDQFPYIKVTVWNSFIESVTGYTKIEVNQLGLPSICGIDLEENSVIKAFTDKIRKAAISKEIIYKITSKSGKIIVLKFKMSFMDHYRNDIVALITDVKDDPYQFDEVLETRENLMILRQVAEHTIDMIAIYNHDFSIKYLSPSHESILGYPIEKLIKAKVGNWIYKEDRDKVMSFIGGLLKEKNAAKVQYRIICADGSCRHLETYGRALYNGTLLEGYIFSSRDVTERVNTEEELIKSRKRYRTLFNNVSDAIYLNKLDVNGIPSRYVEVNDVACKRLGYSREELLSMTIYDTTPGLTMENVFSLIDELSTKGNVIYETYPRTKDGKIVPVEINSIYLILNNEKYVLSISRDISERKEKEKVAEYERLRTEFFANISHELRTPVNVIFSALQLTNSNNKGYASSEALYKRYMPIMKQNCYRLVRLINNLIDVTKIDAGYFHVNMANVNIVSLIENITLSVAHYIENNGVSLIFDTDLEERIIGCDNEKIERIMLNLISNAVKFTESGGSIFVNIFNDDEKVIISVKDTGIGIAKENQESIFDRFVQVDKSFARNREGSGIGLSLVKSMVKMHNGTIKVKSELNKGSEFIITLPVNTIENLEEDLNTKDYLIQDNVEKINIEFSDIYF